MLKIFVRCLLICATLGFSTSLSVGKDRALLIGIDNYRNTYIKSAVGCENDTKLLREFLISKLRFRETDIKVLVNEHATSAHIRNTIKGWLIDETQPGDRVFFAYSGHGTRVSDVSGDEQDRMDEAIAAYDVASKEPLIIGQPIIPVSGYILDDEISEWITNLHGRQVVMLFDSCYSGTISRGAGSLDELESRFLRFKHDRNPEQSDVYSPDHNRGPGNRDTSTITEDFLEKAVNGVLVISAAQADQEAFPIFASEYDRKQGALIYLFVTQQQDGLLPIGKFQVALEKGMEELARTRRLRKGRNGQYQVPKVEIYAQHSAAPIFGGIIDAAWTTGPEIALYNPLSEAKVEIWTADDRRTYSITKRNADGRFGEMIPLAVRTSMAGYLYIWVFSKGDEAKCLFPSRFDMKNFVNAGIYTFPRCIDGRANCRADEMYEYFASEPEGTDVWIALITDKPLSLPEGEYRYTWTEAFQLIGLRAVQNTLAEYAKRSLSRGADVRVSRPTITAWQAGVVVLHSHK